MRYPSFLKDGGRIGLIAPSFSCATEPYLSRYASAKRKLSSMGYTLVEGPNTARCDGVGKSSSAKNCGDEINDFFINDRSDVIISCGGGETMCEDLDFVDFEAIAKAKPKWFMGYSDNTNLVFTLPVLCDTAAVYGICISDFGMEPWHQSVRDHLDVLCGRKLSVSNYDSWEIDESKCGSNPLAPYAVTEPSCMQVFPKTESVSFKGRLIGGCMDLLMNLSGTRYDKTLSFCERYKDDGIIWFMESCEMSAMDIRRTLWKFKASGWFKHAKGFIFGRPMDFESNIMGVDRINAVTDMIGDLGVPIVLDADLGHLPPAMPLIAGSVATVKVTEKDGVCQLGISMELR